MKYRVRIKKSPNAKMQMGGPDGNPGASNEMPVENNTTDALRKQDREDANLEVEKGETVLGDINNDSYLELMTFPGKRHSEGGHPVTIPDGSFIFSDTNKLKIKDKKVLESFGIKSKKKKGYTPAEISKRFQINEFLETIKDPEATVIAKKSAEKMIDNNLLKLSQLSIAQESMKGFPDGIPAISEIAMKEMGITPEMLLPQGPQAASETQGEIPPPDQIGLGESKRGGKKQFGGDVSDLNATNIYDESKWGEFATMLKNQFGEGNEQEAYDLLNEMNTNDSEHFMPNEGGLPGVVEDMYHASVSGNPEKLKALIDNLDNNVDVSGWGLPWGDQDEVQDFADTFRDAQKRNLSKSQHEANIVDSKKLYSQYQTLSEHLKEEIDLAKKKGDRTTQRTKQSQLDEVNKILKRKIEGNKIYKTTPNSTSRYDVFAGNDTDVSLSTFNNLDAVKNSNVANLLTEYNIGTGSDEKTKVLEGDERENRQESHPVILNDEVEAKTETEESDNPDLEEKIRSAYGDVKITIKKEGGLVKMKNGERKRNYQIH